MGLINYNHSQTIVRPIDWAIQVIGLDLNLEIFEREGHSSFNKCTFRHLDTPQKLFPGYEDTWQPSKQRFASSQTH